MSESALIGLKGKTKDEIVAELLARVAEIRERMGIRRDKGGPRVVEKIVLKKFDHTERTPLPGESEEPIETIVIEFDGEVITIPGTGTAGGAT